MYRYMDIWSGILAAFPEEQLVGYGLKLGRILLIVVGLALAGRLGRRLINGLLRPERLPGGWDERRVHTIRGLTRSLLRYSLYFFGGMMVLGELGIRTESILAGAGIIGLAVGFGAQNLVRDVITGFFILFEDQYAVGDYVAVAGVTGTVEEMGLRVTRIREWTGELHTIPNGEIKQVTNFSRGGAGVHLEVQVDYAADLNRATAVINRVCRELAGARREEVYEEPRVLGVSQLGDSGVTLTVFGKVAPMQHWDFARELRKRIKEALEAEGISLPYPHQVIIIQRKEQGDDHSTVSPG